MNRLAQACAALAVFFVLNGHDAVAQTGDSSRATAGMDPENERTTDTTVVHLDQLIDRALHANPELKAAYLRSDAMATDRKAARSLPDPTAGFTYQPFPILTARGYQRSQWRMEQMIPFPGKLRLRGEVAGLRAEIAGSEAEIVAEDVILEIKRAYDELYRVQEQVKLIKEFQAQLRNFEEAALTRYEVGDGLQQSILKAQLERNALNIRIEKLAEDGRSAMERLAFLVELPDTDQLRGLVLARRPGIDPGDGMFDRALAARPEVDALRIEIGRTETNIDLARREFLPDFMLGVNYFDIASGGSMPTATGRDAVALNVGVKVPLWLGRQRANLERAKLERTRARAQLQSLHSSIRTDIENLVYRMERQERQLSFLEQDLLPQARTTLESTLSAYSAGRTNFLDLLDAERMLFNLRMDQVDTHTRYLQTSAELERAIGSHAAR